MKILRDESGHVLIFAPPFGLRVKPVTPVHASPAIQKAEVASPPVAANPPVAAVSIETQHCRFNCRWCESTILLPHDNLGSPFANPYLRKIEVRAIASVCATCSHVAGFSLLRGCYGYDTRYGLVPAQLAGTTVLVDWLRCNEKTCVFPLPLFVTSTEPLTGERAKELARDWFWDDLTCTSGHRIVRPNWDLNHDFHPG
jgi:hypothetical protein